MYIHILVFKYMFNSFFKKFGAPTIFMSDSSVTRNIEKYESLDNFAISKLDSEIEKLDVMTWVYARSFVLDFMLHKTKMKTHSSFSNVRQYARNAVMNKGAPEESLDLVHQHLLTVIHTRLSQK